MQDPAQPVGAARLSPALAFLASPAGILLVWVLHGAWFTLLLPLLTPTIAHVDANSADLAVRSFALAYQFKNPPLYEWLELAVQAVTGPGPRSFLLVRYTLMGLMALAVYAVVARASGSRAQGAAASFGLMSFYWFAWYFHDAISHSILVGLASVVFLALTLRWLERPSTATAVLLGLAVALGMLAKLNFAILLAGVLLTFAIDADLRRRLLDRRLLLSAGIAAALLAPMLLAHLALGRGAVDTIYGHVVARDLGWLEARIGGGARLLASYLLFLLPWGILALVVLRRRPGEEARPPRDLAAERFLARLAVVTAVLVLVGVLAIGARSVSERYLFPVLMAVPLWAHVAMGRRAGEARQMKAFGAFALAVVGLVTLIRIFNAAAAPWLERDNRRYHPYEDLAPALERQGLGNAFFIAADRFESGNLSAFLPDARAAAMETQRRWTPALYPPEGRCVLFFRGPPAEGEAIAAAPEVPASLAPFLPEGAVVETIRIPWRWLPFGPTRTTAFHFVDLGADADACRTVFGRRDGG